MRITHFHAANLLTFENLDLDLTDSPFTILVGPNGAGKTNVFRLIRLLVQGTIFNGTSGGPGTDWAATINAWKRNPNAPSSIEINVNWTETSEGELLASFIQMMLADPEDIARALFENPLTPPDKLRYQPGWQLFEEALMQATSGSVVGAEWSGTLGMRHSGPNDIVFYLQPSIAKNAWVCMLWPHYGIVPKSPQIANPSFTSLASTWIKSLPADTLTTLKQVFNGVTSLDSLSLPVSWPKIWEKYQSIAISTPGLGGLTAQIRNSDQVINHPYWQEILRELRIDHQQPLSLTHVLAHLLNHCVISEDLLSPPANIYDAITWWEKAKSLTSQHLGAHLLKLKNGQDDRDRIQFAEIQKTFEKLSGHHQLDVTMERKTENADSEDPSILIILVQHDPKDSRSIPLTLSGSGFVEIAYLSAVLNSPDSHVILLDEPGRSLHPQALIQLRCMLEQRAAEPSAPQMLVITHSPYLVPPSAPEIVRRVRRSLTTGRTEISRLTMRLSTTTKDQRDAKRRDLERQDRWGRSPNWPALLFSSVVLLVDGETELGAFPEWYERTYHEPIEALGGTILSIGGKTHGGAAIHDLVNLGIPWVMLIDGDSLATGAGNGSGNIWAELEKAERIDNPEANRFRQMPLADQIQRLQEFDIYVMGDTVDDNFETVLQSENPEVELPTGFGESKVIKGRLWAQKVDCPPTIRKVFEKACKVAKFQSGDLNSE